MPNNNVKSNNKKIDLRYNVFVLILAGMALHTFAARLTFFACPFLIQLHTTVSKLDKHKIFQIMDRRWDGVYHIICLRFQD